MKMRACTVGLLVLAACFNEPASDDDCLLGAAGCDCKAGACDAELECVASIDKCVPMDCDPGTRDCTCADGGACFEPYVCVQGVCAEAMGTTAVADDGAPTSSTTDASSSSTSVVDSTIAGSTTDAMVPDPECLACVEGQWVGGSACAEHFEMCQLDPGCAAIYGCYIASGSQSSCCTDTCDTAQMRWNAFVGCVTGQCADCDVAAMLQCTACG